MKGGLSIWVGIKWVFIWLAFMLLYTFLDVAVWRRIAPAYAKCLNIVSVAICMIAFLILLNKKAHFEISLFKNITLHGVILAIGCAILFYLLLDKCLDPIFEGFFPQSEESYQEMLRSLSQSPIITLIQVCILAPIIEEILIRGFLLDGLAARYGSVIALLISAALFALLHFNMVQTLSALISGIVLGWLYLKTESLFCCIIAHSGYNLISYLTMISPCSPNG